MIAEAGSEHYCDSEVGQNDTSDVEVSDAENNLGNTKSKDEQIMPQDSMLVRKFVHRIKGNKSLGLDNFSILKQVTPVREETKSKCSRIC